MRSSHKNNLNKKIVDTLENEIKKTAKNDEKEIKEEIKSAEDDLKKEINKTQGILGMDISDIQFHDVIAVLDKHKNEEIIRRIDTVLKKRLNELSETAYEDIGMTYYYFVRNDLNKNSIIEDKNLFLHYNSMVQFFLKAEKKLQQEFEKEKKKTKSNVLKITKLQLQAFYKMIGAYFLTLESEFRQKNFFDLLSDSYKRRMHYRKKNFLLKQNIINWIGYQIWSITSHYGENFMRWGITSICFVLLFSIIFFISGSLQSVPIDNAGNIIKNISQSNEITGYINHPMLYSYGGNWYDYIYYSVVTFTTLGYGDVLPITFVDKIITVIAVLMGYIMLGVFMTLLAKKF